MVEALISIYKLTPEYLDSPVHPYSKVHHRSYYEMNVYSMPDTVP